MPNPMIKFKSGSSDNLPEPSVGNNGLICFTEDTNKLYFYLKNKRHDLSIDYNQVITKDGTNWSGIGTSIITDSTAIFVSDNTYEDYPYRANLVIENVTSGTYASVCFNLECAVSGNYAPMCETYDGGLYIYSKIDDEIIIPSIVLYFND